MEDNTQSLGMPDISVIDKVEQLSRVLGENMISTSSIAYLVSEDEAKVLLSELGKFINPTDPVQEKIKAAQAGNFAGVQIHDCVIMGVRVYVRGKN
jgi:hypothetical protein